MTGSTRRSTDAQIISVVSPAPWVAVSLGSGMTARAASYVPASRRWWDVIELRGGINGTIATGGATTLATLASQYQPASQVSIPATFDSGAGRLVITVAGALVAFPPSAATAAFLDGLRFALL